MALTPGSRLGVYEVTEQIGAGGMGEVYRATDSNLKRSVAIKVLPASVAGDADRLARFQREAEVLAALNHPNIGAIYGLEKTPDFTALVMELVEGEDLSQRIARGAIPIDEALPIARQIAEALEAAHEQGIIHRDLKPANIKVRPDGTVKVLDFGLAKAMDPAGRSSANAMNSPTLSMHATQAGIILGTAAYMAPEQAAGKTVDKRSDLWAFGVVLLEMLTGRQVFGGETTSHVLAAVLKDEPDWTALPPHTPAPIRRLLRRCLEKDRKRRIESAADARLEIEDALGSPAAEGPRAEDHRRSPLPWMVAAVAGLAAAGFAALYWRQPETPAPAVVRFEIAEPQGASFGTAIRVSPDGQRVVFGATGPGDAPMRLWVRPVNALEGRPVPGTERVFGSPFWTADSRFLIFASDGKLRKIDIEGGPAQSICEVRTSLGGGFVTADGKVVFGTATTAGIQQCAMAGGAASSVTAFKPGGQDGFHAFPVLLPDHRHFLFWRSAGPDSGIYAGSLDARPDEQIGRRVIADSSAPQFMPARGNTPPVLLFVREGTLMAQPFDQNTLMVPGEAVPVATNVNASYQLSASANGTIAYLTSAADKGQPTWFDREGRKLGTIGSPGLPFASLRLAPDGSRFAASGRERGSLSDIWVVDVVQGSEMRLTTDPAADSVPIWSPNGERIVFISDREGTSNLYVRASNGAGADTLLFKSAERKEPADWSLNGFLMFTGLTPNGYAVWVLPMNAGSDAGRDAAGVSARRSQRDVAAVFP